MSIEERIAARVLQLHRDQVKNWTEPHSSPETKLVMNAELLGGFMDDLHGLLRLRDQEETS